VNNGPCRPRTGTVRRIRNATVEVILAVALFCARVAADPNRAWFAAGLRLACGRRVQLHTAAWQASRQHRWPANACLSLFNVYGTSPHVLSDGRGQRM